MKGLTASESKMLSTMQAYLPINVPDNLFIEHSGNGISIQRTADSCTLTLGSENLFPRGISLIQNSSLGQNTPYCETPQYDDLCYMVDCARNAVLKLDAFKHLIVMLACMGYSSIQVYMEDVFEMKNYPYFGYLRGRYTEEELKGLDTFASSMGIELIPAIQTLAHLERALRWNAMSSLRDTYDILLADEDATYSFIEEMFATMARCFTSRKINIGMDEAHMLGLGKYLDKHGFVNRADLMLRHCQKVATIADTYGFAPMMWSDMFFRLAAGGQYEATDISEEHLAHVAAQLPSNMSLVYWNYYSLYKEKYDEMLQAHLRISPRIIFAAGAWKWSGYHPSNHYSMAASQQSHQSCVENGIKQVIVTAWGDNGAESSMFSILPTLQFWAELCYTNSSDKTWLTHRFTACCNASFDAFMALDNPVFTPGNPSPGKIDVNAPKSILYQDILYGLFDRHIDANAFSSHFSSCAKELHALTPDHTAWWHHIISTSAALCDILALKCRAGIDLRKAYQEGNRSLLTTYQTTHLPNLVALLENFITLYHMQWLSENKAAGLDMFDIKLGGLLQRVKTAIIRLQQYLDGTLASIEELEETILYYDGRPDDTPANFDIPHQYWHNCATPGMIQNI